MVLRKSRENEIIEEKYCFSNEERKITRTSNSSGREGSFGAGSTNLAAQLLR
jgi:hypothetical protein